MCVLWARDDAPTEIGFIDHSRTRSEIFTWLHSIIPIISHAYLEDVHSLFGMSAKSNFNFGKNLGIVETLLALQDFPLRTVTPKIWQKAVDVEQYVDSNLKGKDRAKALKKGVGQCCEALYPGCDIWGKRGGLMDGRSDALMIAHYALTH